MGKKLTLRRKGQDSRSSKKQASKRGVLQLNLKKEFFDAIASGQKKVEYRDNTPYWRSRLVGRQYDEINFRNGYDTRAPTMRVQWLGLRRKTPKEFAIRLGKVISIKNYKALIMPEGGC